jgi:hypothetical protein
VDSSDKPDAKVWMYFARTFHTATRKTDGVVSLIIEDGKVTKVEIVDDE